MFLKNENIIFKIRRSKVTDYAALKLRYEKFCVGHEGCCPISSMVVFGHSVGLYSLSVQTKSSNKRCNINLIKLTFI